MYIQVKSCIPLETLLNYVLQEKCLHCATSSLSKTCFLLMKTLGHSCTDSIMTLHITLLGIGNNLTSLQQSHCVGSPFFRIFTITPFCQSLGILSVSQIFSHNLPNYSVVVVMSTFNISPLTLSIPGHFPKSCFTVDEMQVTCSIGSLTRFGY